MSIVKDMSLAEYGRMKIAWVRDFMPALGAIRARMGREKPFAGMKQVGKGLNEHQLKVMYFSLGRAAGSAATSLNVTISRPSPPVRFSHLAVRR